MKKLLAIFAAAAILCACGCSIQTSSDVTTETTTASTTAAQLDDDLALPDVNDSGTTTAPVVTGSTTTTQPTTIPTTAAPEPVTEQAAPAPTETAAPVPTETTPPATEKPTETTTAAPKTAELLQSAVLAPINSGTYTMTVSAFGKDHNSDDKLSKIVRGGETAYWITIPEASLTFKVFPSDGKYYMAMSTQYCELTKAQYDAVCKSFNNAFCDFSALQYQKSETKRESLKKYTIEYFDLNGKTLALWYKGGSLVKMEMDGESLPMTVSGSANSAYFNLDSSLEQVDYETLESLVSLAGAFFGE